MLGIGYTWHFPNRFEIIIVCFIINFDDVLNWFNADISLVNLFFKFCSIASSIILISVCKFRYCCIDSLVVCSLLFIFIGFYVYVTNIEYLHNSANNHNTILLIIRWILKIKNYFFNLNLNRAMFSYFATNLIGSYDTICMQVNFGINMQW